MSDEGCDRVDGCFEQYLPGPTRRILQRNTAWGTLGLWVGVVVLAVRGAAAQLRRLAAVASPRLFQARRCHFKPVLNAPGYSDWN